MYFQNIRNNVIDELIEIINFGFFWMWGRVWSHFTLTKEKCQYECPICKKIIKQFTETHIQLDKVVLNF